MTLEKIYHSKKSVNYLMSHLEGEFHPDFIALRNIDKNLDKSQIPFIKELLKDENKKWFVASYIKTLESFNSELFKILIKVGVETSDPSYNRFFLNPCVRIFGCIDVLNQLTELYKDDNKNGSGILSAVYHVRSLLNWTGQLNDKKIKWELLGFKYNWNSEKECYESFARNSDNKMTSTELEEYLPTHLDFISKKKELILSIKEQSIDKDTIELADRLIHLMEENVAQ